MPTATVATYNIHHGRGVDGRVDLRRTADAIRRTGADLVALQELDRFRRRSGGTDQPAELERLTGMEIAFVPTLVERRSEYGIALAARAGVAGVRAVDLPRRGRDEPRRALVACWRGLAIVATHLSLDPEANEEQVFALVDVAASLPPPVVLLGDLNRPRRSLTPLREAGLVPARVRGGTVRPRWRGRQVDHVLVGPGAALETARAAASRASDHVPVVVRIRWAVEDGATVTYDA